MEKSVVEVVAKESTGLVSKIQSLEITNQSQFQDSADFLKLIKAQQKKVEESFNPIIEKAYQSHKEAITQRDKYLVPLKQAETKLKGLMLGYTAEQERKAREEQARLQKLADQEAEKLRKAFDAKIERAKASGKEEKVEMLEQEKENIIPITAPVVAPQIEKPAGISYRDQWSAEVTDIMLVPREYLIVNLQALNKIAAATKGTLTVPGL